MSKTKFLKIFVFLLILPLLLTSCKSPDGKFKLPGGDARKFPADPAERVKQNLAEGRGFKLNETFKQKGGVFDFASSNELWRASLDTLDFMPLATANYSGGIIVTDWYSEKQDTNESIKISIRFLTNEIRSDALDIKAFNRNCLTNLNCKITEIKGNLISELKKKILKTAAIYQKEKKSKTNKDYKYPNID